MLKKSVWLIVVLVFAPIFEAASDERVPVCSNETAAKDNVERLDTDLVELRDKGKQREAESERQIQKAANALVADGKWTEQQRASFFANVVRSKEFVDLEKQKKSELFLYGLATQTFVTRVKHSNFTAACDSAEDMRRLLGSIGTISDQQYAFMLAGVRRAAASNKTRTRQSAKQAAHNNRLHATGYASA